MNDLLKDTSDRITKAQRVNNEIGTLLADVTDYVTREDYKHALQAAAYLLVAIAVKSGTKPFTALRNIYKAA